MADTLPPTRSLASLGSSVPLVPPLFQSSVYSLPDLDALDEILEGGHAGFIYARDGHPNARLLAQELAALEKASWALICGSGMAAITATLLSVAQQGSRLLAGNSLYGRTTQLFQDLVRYGVQTDFIDPRDPGQVQGALKDNARALFVETMSNPLLHVVDIPALAEICHKKNCLLIVDNTFATPVLTRPLELGADYVVESLTKMVNGHSDVTLGLVCGMADVLPQISQTVSVWGLAANPFDCWLAMRGLTTLALRMRAACASAASLADWLAEQPGVKGVIYPGRTDYCDHEVSRKLLGGGFGSMVTFELADGRDGVNRFLRKAKGIPFSPSLGDIRTTCSHPATTSHRYVSPAERRRQGISDGMIRLSVGIEDVRKIQTELAKGLG
jgi:cystathionine beta-lyase/cystathionine gamma-synthase